MSNFQPGDRVIHSCLSHEYHGTILATIPDVRGECWRVSYPPQDGQHEGWEWSVFAASLRLAD